MSEPGPDAALSPGAGSLIEAAAAAARAAGRSVPGVGDWMLALLTRHGPMAMSLAPELGRDEEELRQRRDALRNASPGAPVPASEIVRGAVERASRRGSPRAVERDVAAAILAAAGHTLVTGGTDPAPRPGSGSEPSRPAEPGQPTGSETRSAAPEPGGARPDPAARPRAMRPTPLLDRLGRDLTRDAAAGRLPKVAGRDAEIEFAVEILCRRTKRNPLLVGAAGVGKTAIAEGIAARVAAGAVPEMLRGLRIVAIQASSLVANSGVRGEFEKRIEALLAESRQEGIALFLDEVHTLIGAGGVTGASDLASLLKPALARGDIACIAATTSAEYHQFIQPDSALERRFHVIFVEEMSPEATLGVLRNLAAEARSARGIDTAESALRRIVDTGARFLRHRHFPDKAVDVFDQCVAHAIATGSASVDSKVVDAVAQRMVGPRPLAGDPAAAVSRQLAESGLVGRADAEAIGRRLAVTLRDLDQRFSRPNCVILLQGPAAARAQPVAEGIAGALLGATARAVTIDLAPLTEAHSVSALIGSPAGYVGFREATPLHRIQQMPWCVVTFRNTHLCHPAVRALIASAIESGAFTDAAGDRIHLSDTVVILAGDPDGGAAGDEIGFGRAPDAEAARAAGPAAAPDWPEVAPLVDFTIGAVPGRSGSAARESVAVALRDLASRTSRLGVAVSWDDEVVSWIAERRGDGADADAWSRAIDDLVAPLLIGAVDSAGAGPSRVRLVFEEGTVRARPEPGGGAATPEV